MPAEATEPGAVRWSPVVVPTADEHPPEAGPPAAPRERLAGDVAREALESAFALLTTHEGALATSDDPVHVHQVRVAIRRIRSELRTFRPLFDPRWADDLRRDLGRLAGPLGAARDADVRVERLDHGCEGLDPTDRFAVRPVLERAARERERTRAELVPLFRERRAALRERLHRAATDPPLSEVAARPAEEVMPRLVRRPWRRLRRKVRALGDDPTDEALHDVRLAAKRCRYAAASVTPVLGRPARRFAKALTRLQDRLGAHQDAVITAAWLRAVATTVDPAAAFVAGELAAAERREARQARDRWRDEWTAARRARLR